MGVIRLVGEGSLERYRGRNVEHEPPTSATLVYESERQMGRVCDVGFSSLGQLEG